MNRLVYGMLAFLLLGIGSSCVYDYDPKDDNIQGLENPLVVIDGDIIVGGITRVSIGLTQPLSGDEEDLAPLGAAVWVESEDGELLSGVMLEDKVNEFEINTEMLDIYGRYRLGVSVPGKGEYISAFKGVLVAPAIDSVSWSVARDSSYVRIEVTTHDSNTDEKLYCKWIYSEDWESNSRFHAELDYVAKTRSMVKLDSEEMKKRSICFSKAESSGTYIANTEKLKENLIYKSVVKEITNTDTRLTGLYAINVTQKALDREAYIYWDNVKNNSNGTGGIFAPQPSNVRGNITCTTNEREVVLGYVNVTTVTHKMLFVDWEKERIFFTDCKEQLIPQFLPPAKPDGEPTPLWPAYYSEGYRPIRFNGDSTDEVYWAMEKCTDCRVFSNSSRPDFWPR